MDIAMELQGTLSVNKVKAIISRSARRYLIPAMTPSGRSNGPPGRCPMKRYDSQGRGLNCGRSFIRRPPGFDSLS